MRFNKINRIILFGGSQCLAELSKSIIDSGKLELFIFTSRRQLNDVIYEGGITLEDSLKDLDIHYCASEDINTEPTLKALITENSLGLGLGEDWSFSKEIITQFNGALIDLMGIRLPQYRGGAHYTWQILQGNKMGASNLQIINEEMIQGIFDSGEIVKTSEYFFPASSRIPADYFAFAVKKEIAFIKEFIKEVEQDHDFELIKLQDTFTQYYPRLNTLRHGYIDWAWDSADIEKFICAFDEPYAGASTFINDEKVHLKNCYFETNDGMFHPYQIGMIYKIHNHAVFIATRSGTLIVKTIIDENGLSVFNKLKQGLRFYTPYSELELAKKD